MGRLLERFKGISPLSRDFYGGQAGQQYRRQEEAYGRALRILRRQARRGDAGSALAEIKVRDQALNQGYTPGGIRDAAAHRTGARDFASAMEASARTREQAAAIAEKKNREEWNALNAPEGQRGQNFTDFVTGGGANQSEDLTPTEHTPAGEGLRVLGEGVKRLGNRVRSMFGAGSAPGREDEDEDEDDELESILGSRRRLGDADGTDTRRLLQTTTRLGSRGFRSAY